MKWKPFFILCFIPILWSACTSNKNKITVTQTNFDKEISVTQNLEFTFNKNIANDSLFDKWLDVQLISFDPPVAGRFKFTSSDKLVFSPLKPFAESENFKAKLSDKLLDYTDEQLITDSKIISFHTPLLDLKSANLYWTKDASAADLILNADLNFSATVNPDAIAKTLQVSAGKQNKTVKFLTSADAKTISLAIYNVNPNVDDKTLKFSIAKGMNSPGSSWKTENVMQVEEAIPYEENLEIRDVTAEHNGLTGTVKIITNQQIANANLNELVQLNPNVNYTIEKLSNGLIISSDEFTPSADYTVTISDKILGVAGGKIPDAYTTQITFGQLKPALQFANTKGKYLSKYGNRNLAITIINIPKVKVTVSKIYENNILAFMRDGMGEDYYYDYNGEDEESDYYNYKYVNTELYGNTIFEKEYTTENLEKKNAARILNLDFTDRLQKFEGFYVITIASTDKTWLTDTRIVSVSDIGLIAKASDKEITVFANSVNSAQPLPGIKVSCISANNQKIYSATTDKKGVAKFSNIKKNLADFKIALITAETGNDYNFLPFSETEVSTSRFDVGGKRLNESNLDAFLYSQRNLYRPGETIYMSGIIRDYDLKNITRIAVKLKLVLPSGNEFKTLRKTLDDEGAFETAFDIPKSAPTGTYTVELFSSNDILLASENISVEEFMPDRIRVTSSLPRKEYYPAEKIIENVAAYNLFGTAAANRNYEAEFSLERKTFIPKDFSDYNFYINTTTSYFSGQNTQGKTDDKGELNVEFQIPAQYADVGILDGRILTTVFDESGRPVYNTQQVDIITQNIFFGIGNFDSYTKTRDVVRIPVVAVDKDGKLMTETRAQVDILKHEWQTVIEKSGKYYNYRSNQITKVISSNQQNIRANNTTISFVPDISGEYEIRISRPGATNYVSQYFYAYGYGDTRSTSFEVNNEGNINIKADKDEYVLGETANLLFTAPFNGNMLITVERDKVYEYYYLNTDKKSASLQVKLNDNAVPNIYVTATLFRPADNSELPLTVAHGIINLNVENKTKKLPLTIDVAKQSRSNTKQKIKIKTVPDAEVTVSVVDEGVLQIKNYQTPDPYKWFYMTRALSVNSFDMYAYLYPEIFTKKLLSGGDAASGRLNPVTVNRVKLVTYWSGILHSDKNGNASYEIDIPQFSGDLRVMTIAYKNDKFVSNESHIKVSDPIVVTTSLPRFLSPGDTVAVSVTLANTTNKNLSGTVTINSEGAVNSKNAAQNFSVTANKEGRVVFNITAANTMGAGKIKVTVKPNELNESYTDETEIAVRAPASLQTYTGSGYVDANKTGSFSLNTNLITDYSSSKLILSRSPIIQFADNLEYLIQYPHGCVEQITSAAFPQIYFADLVKVMYGTDNSAANKQYKNMDPNYNVQEAIRILQSMQMYNGALMYWPGEGYESWWGSIYAAHFLYEAKQAGFNVDDNVLDKLYGYMKNMLKEKKTFVYRYNQNLSKEIASKEVFYSLYVLALAGKPEIPTMNYYKANPGLIPLDGKYLLAVSYALVGDKKNYEKLLPPAFAGEESNAVFGGSFYSPIRDKAIALDCMLDVDANNQQVGELAKQLGEMLKTQKYLNTQERAFSLLALGKIARKTKDNNITATIYADNKNIAEFKGNILALDTKELLKKNISIQTKGTGRLYYFWQTKGLSADGSYLQEDKYLRVRKNFYDRNGNEVNNLMNIKQNDLIVVKISIAGVPGTLVDNVVITDILPAGFEIENERIRESNKYDWIKDISVADYEDIRDDRINIYTSVTGRVSNYYYTVRAVSPGTYKMGPVMADAMYNGEYHSYNGGGMVRISQ